MLRRRQEREEDKAATKHLRRTGLPTRVLIDKVGSQWWALPGGVDQQVAHVANALAARRIVFEDARRRSAERGALTPASEVEYIMVDDRTMVARNLQDEIMARINHHWRQTEQGKQIAQKARDRVAAGAQKKQQRGVGASTPDQGTEAQFERAMKGYFKTHCDQAYGGQLWMKYLITLGDIPERVVECVNDLTIARTKDRRGPDADHNSKTPDNTPGNIYLSRVDRASTPVPENYVKAKTLREIAYNRVHMLVAWKQEGYHVDQQTMDFARQKLHEAEEASKKSMFKFQDYWGDWQNDFRSTQGSMFEMVLEHYLIHDLHFDKAMLDQIMRKREAGSASTAQAGSASTPAQAPQAQAGKGPGSSGGSGGSKGGKGGGKGGR